MSEMQQQQRTAQAQECLCTLLQMLQVMLQPYSAVRATLPLYEQQQILQQLLDLAGACVSSASSLSTTTPRPSAKQLRQLVRESLLLLAAIAEDRAKFLSAIHRSLIRCKNKECASPHLHLSLGAPRNRVMAPREGGTKKNALFCVPCRLFKGCLSRGVSAAALVGGGVSLCASLCFLFFVVVYRLLVDLMAAMTRALGQHVHTQLQCKGSSSSGNEALSDFLAQQCAARFFSLLVDAKASAEQRMLAFDFLVLCNLTVKGGALQ